MTKDKKKILLTHLEATLTESRPSTIADKAFEEIYEAMDEYAKQEAIEFAKWMLNSDVRHSIDEKTYRYWNESVQAYLPIKVEQLYQKFLEQKQK